MLFEAVTKISYTELIDIVQRRKLYNTHKSVDCQSFI